MEAHPALAWMPAFYPGGNMPDAEHVERDRPGELLPEPEPFYAHWLIPWLLRPTVDAWIAEDEGRHED